MFLPPRLGNRKPATPGISSRSHRTSALPSALGTLVRYTVADASGEAAEGDAAARPREEAGGLGGLGLGDDVEGSDASGAEPEPEPETMRSTRPMAPSTRRTFIPCGWCLELVRNSRTTPRVSRPVL